VRNVEGVWIHFGLTVHLFLYLTKKVYYQTSPTSPEYHLKSSTKNPYNWKYVCLICQNSFQVSQYTFAMCSYREKKAEPVELLQLDGYTVDYTDPQPGNHHSQSDWHNQWHQTKKKITKSSLVLHIHLSCYVRAGAAICELECGSRLVILPVQKLDCKLVFIIIFVFIIMNNTGL